MAPPAVIDARGLLPPEPLERTLEALETLATEAELVVLLDREPLPLYGILERNGYAHDTRIRPDGVVEVRIRQR